MEPDLGWRDGCRGFIVATINAFYEFCKYASLWAMLADAAACARGSGVRTSQAPALAGDTLFILSTPTYTVTAHRRDDMIPTTALNRAARTYERLFGTAPPHVLVFLGNVGSAPDIDWPIARDTVRFANDSEVSAASMTRTGDARRAAFLMACAWVTTAVERVAQAAESDSAILIPTWFEAASAMLITSDGTEWPARLDRAQRLAGVLSVEELLGNGDRSVLPNERATAMDVQSAALLEYFSERDPHALVGLPARLGGGTAIQLALLGRTAPDLQAVNADWRNWYLRVQRGGK